MTGMSELLELSPRELRGRVLSPVLVVVIDSGIDGSHPDLSGKIVRAVRMVEDADGGAVRVVERVATENNDSYGHGTGVASRILQLAPNARFIDVCTLGPDNTATGKLVVSALRWALEQTDAPLINLSIAITIRFAPELRELGDVALERGRTVVASMRNLPRVGDLGFPASTCGAIGVQTANVPEDSVRYDPESIIQFEARGKCCVAAPGGGYADMIGTSFATPAITSMCCLLAGARPALTSFECRSWLRQHAERTGGLVPSSGVTSDRSA